MVVSGTKKLLSGSENGRRRRETRRIIYIYRIFHFFLFVGSKYDKPRIQLNINKTKLTLESKQKPITQVDNSTVGNSDKSRFK